MTTFPHDSPRPLLLVDVDGVISLFGFALDERPGGRFLTVDGIVHFISEQAAGHLLALARDYELVWCTGWEERANEYLVHELGLPGPLPVLSFDRPGGSHLGHWKLAAIAEHAGPDRPLAWIDDAHDDACHVWAAERPGPTLLVPTDPPTGLTERHATQLARWAARLSDSV